MLSAKSTTLQRRATLLAAEVARAEAELLEAERLADDFCSLVVLIKPLDCGM